MCIHQLYVFHQFEYLYELPLAIQLRNLTSKLCAIQFHFPTKGHNYVFLYETNDSSDLYHTLQLILIRK